MAEYIFSPQQKRIMEPFLKYLEPSFTEGKKELVVNRPGEIGFEDYAGKWHFQEAPELTQEMMGDTLDDVMDEEGDEEEQDKNGAV